MSTEISPQKAELMGVCMGDGCISITERYKELAISGDIEEDKRYYQEHLIPLFNEEIALPTIGKKIKGKGYTSTGVYGIITFNEKIVNRMLELGLEPSPKINNRVPQVIRKRGETGKPSSEEYSTQMGQYISKRTTIVRENVIRDQE